MRMRPDSYPAAQAAAPRVHAHLAALLADAGTAGADPLPDPMLIQRALDVAFWASLRREEGRAPSISLALVPLADVETPLRFARPLPLAAAPLARLSPAVERPGIHLGVWPDAAGVDAVWGTTMTLPPRVAVIEVVAPGLIVVKARRDREATKYTNILVLEGDDARVLDTQVPRRPECPQVVSSLFDFESVASWVASADLLVQLATSMRTHGRGGALIVLPPHDDAWRASVAAPLAYELAPPWAVLKDAVGTAGLAHPDGQWPAAVTRAVAAVAGLTAVDGAALLTRDHEVVAFGAKLVRRKGWPAIERLFVTEPVEGRGTLELHPVQVGGTRHLSAAQFIHDQRDASALVASQDGRFTVFTWSTAWNAVHAHRVEALLL